MWRDVIEWTTPGVLLLWWGLIVTEARRNAVISFAGRLRVYQAKFHVVLTASAGPLLEAFQRMQVECDRVNKVISDSSHFEGRAADVGREQSP